MRSRPGSPLVSSVAVRPLRPDPPAWVSDLFPDRGVTRTSAGESGDLSLRAWQNGIFTLLSAGVREPDGATAQALADAVASAYRSLGRELQDRSQYAIRIWNFVPNIQGAIEGAGDRYMAFNVGRFAAYCDWFGGAENFSAALPTSSAVGVESRDVWVHVLAADAPGLPVENPRQIPSYRYSRRYGVRPPCFARATRVGSQLFIGGTASILGEQSKHVEDIVAQTRETFENLSALIDAASPSAHPLHALTSLRVHVRDAHDAATVQSMLEDRVPRLTDVEMVQAALCRKELLVEIEGVAECPTTPR